ncbi:YihY/virulence factor BrkB family protein [Sanyastnella coralliicola]|uniref:YihY/virulence factor BrkB family protein n=1 Tax=Sanyastnella coralliicola TaxID=3069118 RepID=UPI0027B9B7E8|nr:YihY/virulence factor BrkB family protein [Longitalea sp. SCSIO 12813]
MKKLRQIWTTVKRWFEEFFSAEPFAYSSSIAFYTLFSLPAILFFVIEGAGLLLDKEQIRSYIRTEFSGILGFDFTASFDSILTTIQTDDQGTVSIIGLGTLLIGSTTIFGAVQSGLNRIWNVKPSPSSGFLKIFLDRLFSFGIVLTLGLLMIFSLAVEGLLLVFHDYLTTQETWVVHMATLTQLVIGILLNAALFTAVFRVLPDAKVSMRNALFGGLATATLFTGGKYLISWYLTTNDLGSVYGAAGSIVLLLIWVYYTSFILLVGGKITEVLQQSYGGVSPSKYAIKYVRKEVSAVEQSSIK